MEKHLSIAQKPLISKGHFYFKNSGFLYWSYNSPFVSGYLLEDSKVYSWKYIGTKKKVEDITKQTYAKRMVEFIYMFLSMDMEKISKVYSVQESENSLELYPKKNVKGNTLEKIKLYSAILPEFSNKFINYDSGEIVFENNKLFLKGIDYYDALSVNCKFIGEGGK